MLSVDDGYCDDALSRRRKPFIRRREVEHSPTSEALTEQQRIHSSVNP